ncbi:MAG: OmpA family protein [Pseudomonadota bacterium]|nr:OmpA family protein [Pseudomonadota bacterium]
MILLLPLALVGCKKKLPDDGGGGEVLNPPSVRLQVAAIDPGQAPADRTLDAEIFGSGFEDGARVAFNGAAASSVRYVDENSLRVGVPAMPIGSYDVVVTNPDGTKATLRKGLTLTEGAPSTAGCASTTVRFELDSAVLDPGTRRELDLLAPCLREGTATVRIEGHCDQSGTTDYNIALGQRRAEAVQRYLVGLSVSPARLRTVSYGEERPVDRSGTSSADAANRRAEILVRE